ncbi:MAG: polyamine ABC transporter ATP-binding protein [marine bacterium B5-7]|nr:MAG: polyamine ABC transporter ATP-binding protein [marine bacterium B5-7]
MTTPAVELVDIVKRFGAITALQPMSLTLPEGSFVTLLGPSGCGKTTTLRMVAGLLDPSAGEIRIKGKRVNETPIHKRNLGLVFQNYALFPHKTVYDNVAFGLRYRDIERSQIKKLVNEALDLVQLPSLGDRYPKQLSGGQQQRIALARAIVIKPDVLLLDEPLSALDANLREDMRVELKRIQHQLGITTLFVTHDQSEALAMSDTIVVMSAGNVEQVGAPEEVYNTPSSEFVARFLGASNIIESRTLSVDGEHAMVEARDFGNVPVPIERVRNAITGRESKLVIRAEFLTLNKTDKTPADGVLSVNGQVETVDYQGQAVRYFVRVGDRQLQAINMIDGHPFAEGETVSIHVRPRDCALLPGAIT